MYQERDGEKQAPRKKRKRERPKKSFIDLVREDMQVVGVAEEKQRSESNGNR